jgi:hypothetical protein
VILVTMTTEDSQPEMLITGAGDVSKRRDG